MENKHIINGRRVASDKISTLAPGEIFVFGSNMEGMHGGGAARYANKNFGAEWGVGEGLTGRTYALPTMEGKASMKQAVEHFTSCAKEHPGHRHRMWHRRIHSGGGGAALQGCRPTGECLPAAAVLGEPVVAGLTKLKIEN